MQWTSAACALLAAVVLLLVAGPACDRVELHSFPVLLQPMDPPMACAASWLLGFLCLGLTHQHQHERFSPVFGFGA